ncbi:DUF4041 domain-containing protein [Streptacidiphilus sp. N1-10]|uniref:DUF4041 domain-containing protein n=1 Tax=Streptacidiphilus jeojiensis TaxID=3229225 RepID=A0ABV6XNB6_9ACTN
MQAVALAHADAERIRAEAEEDARELRLEARTAVRQETAEMRAVGQEAGKTRKDLEKAQRELFEAQGRLAQAQSQIVVTEEAAMLQQVGVYNYQHPLQDSIAYRTRLDSLQAEIKQLIRVGQAVQSISQWTVNGSQREGKKMVQDFSKLMLRAYNAEADQAVRTMRPHRVGPLVDRLYKTRETIAKLGATMQIRIADSYHDARVRELWLTADYLQKKDEEKEAQREARARQREEERAQREFDREREKLDKERNHVQAALQRLRERGDTEGILDLESKLADIESALRSVEARAANIRTGYVYVISNVGAFGDRMVKIGLTRRLEPLDRIYELSGASVPFRFDVHALIFSDDAVGLETQLHQHFADRRVNQVNTRREFFYVSPSEVRDALQTYAGQHLIEFTDEPEALEWRASSTSGRP